MVRLLGFPGGSVVKNLPASAGDTRVVGSIPGSGRSPRERNGHLLQYSSLENPCTEEPGGLWSMGSQRVRNIWGTHTHTRCGSQSRLGSSLSHLCLLLYTRYQAGFLYLWAVVSLFIKLKYIPCINILSTLGTTHHTHIHTHTFIHTISSHLLDEIIYVQCLLFLRHSKCTINRIYHCLQNHCNGLRYWILVCEHRVPL